MRFSDLYHFGLLRECWKCNILVSLRSRTLGSHLPCIIQSKKCCLHSTRYQQCQFTVHSWLIKFPTQNFLVASTSPSHCNSWLQENLQNLTCRPRNLSVQQKRTKHLWDSLQQWLLQMKLHLWLCPDVNATFFLCHLSCLLNIRILLCYVLKSLWGIESWNSEFTTFPLSVCLPPTPVSCWVQTQIRVQNASGQQNCTEFQPCPLWPVCQWGKHLW